MESSCTNNPSPLILPACPHHKCVINRRFKGVLSYCENKSLPETGIPNLFYLFYFYFYDLDPILHIFHMFGVLFIHSAPRGERSSRLSPIGSWRTREFCCFHFSVSKVVETWALSKKRWANRVGQSEGKDVRATPQVGSVQRAQHFPPLWDPGTWPLRDRRAGRGLWERLKRVLSHFSHVGFCDPRTALQAPLSMGFPRQQYWNGLPCPPPGDLPDPDIEPTSLVSPALAGGFFTTTSPGKPLRVAYLYLFPYNRRRSYKQI